LYTIGKYIHTQNISSLMDKSRLNLIAAAAAEEEEIAVG
jgi:hypothetical protein